MTEFPEPLAPADEGLGPLLRPERLSAWCWVLAYTAILSTISVLRYHLWIANGLDLGLYEQGLWLILHHGLMAPTTYTGYPIVESGGSWFVYPLALVYAIGGVGLLLVVQAFALGLGYLFIDRIGTALGIDGRLKHLLAVAYLLSPTVLGTNLFDFHPVVLAVPLFFWMLLACVEGNDRSLLIAAALAIAASDLSPILVLGAAVVLFVRKRPAVALALVVATLILGSVDWFVALPAANHGWVPDWTTYFGALGASPLQGMAMAFSHPGRLFTWVRGLRSWEYLVALVIVPVGFLVLTRAPRVSLWWVPVLLLVEVNLLSGVPIRTSPFDEFSVTLVPFMFVAILEGLRGVSLRRRQAVALAVLSLLAFGGFVWQQHRTFWRSIPSQPTALQAAVAAVPQGAPVVAQNFVIAHLSDRSRAWLPEAVKMHALPTGTYVLLDPLTTTGTTPRSVLAGLRRDILAKGEADVIFSQNGITLVRLLRPITAASGPK